MEVVHHERSLRWLMPLTEFFEDALGPGRAASFDQDQVAGRRQFPEKFGGFRRAGHGRRLFCSPAILAARAMISPPFPMAIK